MAKPYSLTLVSIQFICLGFLLLSGPWFPAEIPFQVLAISCVGLGLWALVSMDRNTFQVLPEPRPEGKLITDGPYRFVRHPMYTAVLGYGIAVTADAVTLLRVIVWVILVTDLIAKLTYEERLLRQRFSDYQEYAANTSRLIPFLY